MSSTDHTQPAALPGPIARAVTEAVQLGLDATWCAGLRGAHAALGAAFYTLCPAEHASLGDRIQAELMVTLRNRSPVERLTRAPSYSAPPSPAEPTMSFAAVRPNPAGRGAAPEQGDPSRRPARWGGEGTPLRTDLAA